MPCIFVSVWDNNKRDKSPVLCTTAGGPPHITVYYDGDATREELFAKILTMTDLRAVEQVTLEKAYVNSFKLSSGEMRHDVLLSVDDTVTAIVQKYRPDFRPHVTHAICDTKEEAVQKAATLNKNHLPVTVCLSTPWIR